MLAFWDNDYQYDKEYNPSEDGYVFGGNPARYGDLGRDTWRENKMFDIAWILRPLGRDYIPLSSRRRGELQSSILLCGWCTRDRIRKQFPDLARLIISRWCINPGYIFEDENQCRALEELLHSEKEEELYECDVVRVIKQRPERTKEGERVEEENEFPHCHIKVKVGEFVAFDVRNKHGEPVEVNSGPGVEKRWFPLLSIRAIPSSLLSADINANHKGLIRGFFTEMHMSLLNTIRISGQLMVHMPPQLYTRGILHSRDAIKQGIRIALTTLNPCALDVLLKIDHFIHRRGRGHQEVILSDHFRIAALMYINVYSVQRRMIETTDDESGTENAQNIALLSFCLLLHSSAESVPHDDPVVRQFAQLVGGAFGRWLLDFMADLPQYLRRLTETDTTGYCGVFFARGPSMSNRMGLRYTREVVRRERFFRIPSYWLFNELPTMQGGNRINRIIL